MTKVKTTGRLGPKALQPKTDPSTVGAEPKRLRGKSAAARAMSTGTEANATLTETPITDAIPAATSKPPRQTKAALLRARLAEPGGVSLAALIGATGWQAHTLRAYLSGLRKEGLTLIRRREGEDTIYAINPNGSTAGKTVAEGAEKEAVSEAPRDAMPEGVVSGAAEAADATLPAETNG